jgi:uncharacterized protein
MRTEPNNTEIITVEALRTQFQKFDALCTKIESYKKLAVAFSGGVDSTFLIKVASEVLGQNALAITVNSPYIANWEIEEAKELTDRYGIKHLFIEVGIPEEITHNPKDRCYLCKGKVFSTIKANAKQMGISIVADGSNADDTKDYRPGMRALSELDIQSPLLECDITKDEIRQWSKMLALETWDKPPYACLLTRLPYGTMVDMEDLRKIEAAEAYLIGRGIRAVRVRKHEGIARIEIEKNELPKVFDLAIMSEIAAELKQIGFEHVTLDLEGYTMGSFNKGVV